ncbi:hypothetical protein [Micromonospora sp. HM5-17]|uniref:hypothetical protein n=1 Tax=Micromonospora sp. HM5-17 TaxID=2487710 RepID=UPI001F1719E3|nr:hypothetical protein [Micromonospora sp. HM5-17]
MGEASDAERSWSGGRTSPGEPGYPYAPEAESYPRHSSGPEVATPEDYAGSLTPSPGSGDADAGDPARHGYAEQESGTARPASRWEPAHGHPGPTSGLPAAVSGPPPQTSAPPYDEPGTAEISEQRSFPATSGGDRGARERTALLPAPPRQSSRVSSAVSGPEAMLGGPGGAESGSGGGPGAPNGAAGGPAEPHAPGHAWSSGWAPRWAAPSPAPTSGPAGVPPNGDPAPGVPVGGAEPADEARGGGHRRDAEAHPDRGAWSPPSWAEQSVQRLPVQRQPAESAGGSGARDGGARESGHRDGHPHQPAYPTGLTSLAPADSSGHHTGPGAQPGPDGLGYPSGPGAARHPESSGYPAAGGDGYPAASPGGYGPAEPSHPPAAPGGYASADPGGYPARREALALPTASGGPGTGYPRPVGESAPMVRPAEQGVDALPQRIPAEPDVPTVPEPPAVEPPTETPELARIATHLRREDGPVQPRERPDGFDVDAIVAAVRGVPGVRDASVRTTPAGAHSLRLDLADGADPAEVSRQVARLLQERMGLAAAPRNLPAPASSEPGRGRAPGAPHGAGQPRHAPAGASRPGGSAPGGPSGAAAGAYGPPTEVPRRRRQSPPRSRPTGGEHPEEASEPGRAPAGPGGAGPTTVGAYSGSPVTTTETAPSRPLNPGAPPGPRVIIDHVQVSTFGLDATVEVRLAAGDRPAAGLATGPAVDGYVLRLCAVAAAAAIDELLSSSTRVTERGRCFVEHAAVVPFGSCEVATVVVLLVCDGWVEQLAGSALVAGDPRQAVVRATLAAVNRRLEALLA